LAWSTTPWNKLATPALAVNPKLTYVKVKQGRQFFILAKTTLKILKGEYETVDSFKGLKMEGLAFEPHFDFYPIKTGQYAYVVTNADFVGADEGTGVVTIAAYGEDDFKLMKEKNIPMIEHIDQEGMIKDMVKGYGGMYYLKANQKVNEELAGRDLIYRQDKITHSVPVCWRCKARLIYAPQKAWFINVQKLKKKLLESNDKINWIPEHIKKGRFAMGIKEAPDWCISRNRYWATPMPVWKCNKCKAQKVVGSIAEIEKLSGKKVKDLHRPYIDEFVFKCECGGKMKRIPEVLDCWLESGSMPYGERHYPFENKKELMQSFPADFISEYVAQTRAWFYVMHVLSNALFGLNCFKNVIVTGVIMGSDGRKMSKSYGNYPDPKKTLEKYGGDAVRLFLMNSALLSGENVNVSEDDIKDQLKTIILPIYNCLRYYSTYAELFRYKAGRSKSHNILDKWIKLRLNQFVYESEQNLTQYLVPPAVRLIQPFVSDLSTWFIRLSRQRFVRGDKEALATLYEVLYDFSRAVAPTIPFISEEVWQFIKDDKDKESVHLTDYPSGKKLSTEEEGFLQQMQEIRDLISLGHRQRKEQNLPLRQPLAKAEVKSGLKRPSEAMLTLVKQELNVKKLLWTKAGAEASVVLDTKLTKELEDEGEARNLVRKIGAMRKKMNLGIKDKITVKLPSWPEKYTRYIIDNAMVKTIKKAKSFEVETE